MILCIYVLSVLISPFSFLILLIWFLSLCFLMSLASGLSILFIFSKNQLLALLIFVMGAFLHCWQECKQVQPLWRTVCRFLKKLELELPYDLAIPLLGIHTKETKIERDTCSPMFITALFTIARTWKQPRCPSADKWIRKLWCKYTMEWYSVIKKNAFELVLMR